MTGCTTRASLSGPRFARFFGPARRRSAFVNVRGRCLEAESRLVRESAVVKMGGLTDSDERPTNSLDPDSGCFRSRSSIAQRRRLATRVAAAGTRGEVLAGFDMDAREVAPEGDSVRVGRSRERVRRCGHEPSTRIVPPPLRSPPQRTRRDGRLSRRSRRLRPAEPLASAGVFQPLRVPPPGARTLPGFRPLPQGGGAARPEVSGGGRASALGKAVHHRRARAGQGDHAGEQGGRPAEVLPSIEAGGEGGRG
jgi:hypothetical protein